MSIGGLGRLYTITGQLPVIKSTEIISNTAKRVSDKFTRRTIMPKQSSTMATIIKKGANVLKNHAKKFIDNLADTAWMTSSNRGVPHKYAIELKRAQLLERARKLKK